jgi:hypothetical protein
MPKCGGKETRKLDHSADSPALGTSNASQRSTDLHDPALELQRPVFSIFLMLAIVVPLPVVSSSQGAYCRLSNENAHGPQVGKRAFPFGAQLARK